MTVLSTNDIELLRRFEPILCFNQGEQFFPMDVERYIAEARLCIQRPNELPQTLVPRGQLTVDHLIQLHYDTASAVYYLNFAEPLPPVQVREFRQNSSLRHFHAGQGRLARVGLLARLGDLLFSISLLMRGRVPGGLAAGAAMCYQKLQKQHEHYCYYGRVIREHGYIALQYWFFYAFNDWRSSFNGVNDHEADWEMITVYVTEDENEPGAVIPCWLAYSSHEFEGDDLRRRWDDPDLEREGNHPLVYVAAGSHANYYFRGEYLPTATVPYVQSIMRAWRRVRYFWQTTLRQGDAPTALPETGFIRIPFVDYARGDGLRIGPNQKRNWELRLLQRTEDLPAPAWVDGYRGLWGLYTGDLIAGEDAPARPKYHRDGTVHKMWYDPIGWSGLDKVPPPNTALAALERQQRALLDKQADITRQIEEQAQHLTGLEMEAQAIQGLSYMRTQIAEVQRQIQTATSELDRLKSQRATNAEVLERCTIYAQQLISGQSGDPHAHLHLPQLPASVDDIKLGRGAETWSAISIGFLLIGYVVIAQSTGFWGPGVLILLGVYTFLEALFRHQIQNFIRTFVVGLALITTLVLVVEFFPQVVLTLVLLAGLVIIIENVREIRA
ncbi:MAG: hypothetical protein MI924_19870 [Chloroflexales bacterium]|nr:hypothetical protein [Chloroflexales bacterium]